ncbi:MAG: glycosyltransferase family 2 protein [Verrucomicrobiota bacterium]
MLISVIISTYNNPLWLEKVLWGYANQKDREFEIVVADDGSDESTRSLITRFEEGLSVPPIKHVWHEDRGFRKSAILNKATLAAAGEYLVFTDGDCIPPRDFIAIHRKLAKPGQFLSGGYFKLPMGVSEIIDKNAVDSGQVFALRWLWSRGMPRTFKNLRLGAGSLLRGVLDKFIPTKPTWNGNNSSAFRDTIISVNGHDERMAYGGQDVEMGYRLVHSGIKPRRIRYRALVLHLDHKRGYADPSSIAKNLQIRQNTLKLRIRRTDYGIVGK